jgi:type IV secretory pathway VirB4 component
MLNLAEYRHKTDRLADYLPWAALIAPGIVLNKDGSLQRSFLFRGPDLESASEAELIGLCARANNALKRCGSGWAFFFEAERIEAQHYPTSRFPDPASWLVEEERRVAFEGETDKEWSQWSDDTAKHHRSKHFESFYYLTLLYMPPPDAQARTEKALLDSGREEEGRDWLRELGRFQDETERMLDLLSGFLPEIRALDDAETLTYLHGTISPKRHTVAVPDVPMYLDGILVDAPFTGGLEPMLGGAHLRTLTILGFPNTTCPGILDALNHQDSTIAPALIESCPQRLFLPNDRAVEPQARVAYERFGLNERQIELIAHATPKRHYYLQSRRGNRLFDLGLGPVALALCGTSDAASQVLIDGLLAQHDPKDFAAEFLKARGLDWASALVRDFATAAEAQKP